MKTNAIIFENTGSPEVLKYHSIPLNAPADGEVLIRHHAIGVNFIDTYFRSGLYETQLPSGLGFEAAGVVEQVGSKVTHVKPGDRVAYAQGPLGAYAEHRNIPGNFVVKIPDAVSFEDAASVMLKGLTVSYLFQDIFSVKKDDLFLFHAAAGGTGIIACQWARHLGARMIGTVSSVEKAKSAKENGAAYTINYSNEDVVKRVLEISENKKLPVVYDGVGKSTWTQSLDCLAPRGLMVSFGNASGAVTGVALSELASRGSLFVTRPMLWAYMNTHEKLSQASAQLFDLVARGVIKPGVSEKFSLKDAGRAHENLLDRSRVGSLLLIP
ncbi:MAG: quinone oxidoreductase [Bdellovibrionota bacterium]